MEIPGFHEELETVLKRYTFLCADPDQALRELEKFVSKIKGRWAAKSSSFLMNDSFATFKKFQKQSF